MSRSAAALPDREPQWSIAVLLTKRIGNDLELLLVPVFVQAPTARAAMDRAEQAVQRDGWSVRGCSFVEADGEVAHSEGLTWRVGAWLELERGRQGDSED